MLEEEWEDIPGYEGLYQANKEGDIRSLSYKNSGKPKLLKPQLINSGYHAVHLREKGTPNGKTICCHRIIAMTFIPNPNELPQVNHKNGIKTDNRVENLEWCTQEENMAHAIRTLGVDTNKYRKVPVICVETGKHYGSYIEAQNDTGICAANIRHAAEGTRKKDGRGHFYAPHTAGGYHWARARKVGIGG